MKTKALETSAAERVIYYSAFTDDVVESADQNILLPENYEWIKKSPVQKFLYHFLYILVLPAAVLFCRINLHARFYGKEKIKKAGKKGFVVYANHTQMVGDAFIPSWIFAPHHTNTVISPANYGIPVLGKILDYLGGLPVPQKLSQFPDFNSAVAKRLKEGRCVIVYPEAHVWPYFTGIRPFTSVSFSYAVDNDVPVYSMTSTYYKRKHGEKPGMKIYIDGPFFADKNQTKKQQRQELCDKVTEQLKERSKLSSYSYIQYVKKENV